MSSAAIRWGAGIVALGAVVATAHGLFEVAAAARVPDGIAWLYPLVTDGLALVSYAATTRLAGAASRYAWTIVVLAAGLSGLAQAVYLATDLTSDGSGAVVLVLPGALRFGVGAWPAIAAALVAHLLYLLASGREVKQETLETDSSATEVEVSRAATPPPAPESVPAVPLPVASTAAEEPTPDPGDDAAVLEWAVARLRRDEHAGAGTLQKLGVSKRRAENLAAQARQQYANRQKPRLVSG